MKRLLSFFAMLLLYAGIVLAQFQQSRLPLADPFVLYEDGTYYAYGTYSNDGIVVFTSSNLIEWEQQSQLALHRNNCTESIWFWAPEVYHIGDEYIMYYSANEHLFVAKSSSPLGPFIQEGGYQMESMLGSEKCIDSSMFIDDDGTAYLFFVRFTDGNCIWMCRLADDYITPVPGTLKYCFSVSAAWENIWPRVVEGPNMVKHNGIYYLTYSANSYESKDYAIGYATSTSLSSPEWKKSSSNPIVRRVYDLVGTGHHTIFNDADGDMRIAFHAHNSTTTIHPRLTYIGRMQFSGDLLEMTKEPFIRPVFKGDRYVGFEPSYLIDTERGYERGGSLVIDLNSDGHLDMVSGGATRSVQNDLTTDRFGKRRAMHISLWDDAAKQWTLLDGASSAIQVADYPTLLPCDINHDCIPDIVAFETIGKDTSSDVYVKQIGHEGIFLGNGDGTFRTAQLSITDADGSPCDFNIRAPHTATLLDCNNDGLTDIVCAGYQDDTNYNFILINRGFSGDVFSFSAIPFLPGYKLNYPVLKAADFNGDGFSDFIISANVLNMDGVNVITEIFLNDPNAPGNFIPMNLRETSSVVKPKGGGTLQVADFNGDGRPDFFLAGQGDSNLGDSNYEQTVYLNKGGASPSFKVITGHLKGSIYKSAISANAAGVIDWNGDGSYDIIVSGTSDKINNKTTAHVYTNQKDTGVFYCFAQLPGAMAHTISFPDYDGDGTPDYCCHGYFKDDIYLTSDQLGRTMVVALNSCSPASRPEAPSALNAAVSDNSVTLSWEAPASALGCESFEYFVKDSQGNLVTDCLSIIGGELDGVRKSQTMGNAGGNKLITFFPPKPGTYTWGVQTVNAAYRGSSFAIGNSFTFTDAGVAHTAADIPAEVQHYGVNGVAIDASEPGVHIVRHSNGSYTKKLVK
ncbi:MAG: family 43 glycosylhydrolase [Muribaculaceae bacterium]